MTALLDSYLPVTGEAAVHHLRQLAKPLQGKVAVHVNSTRVGGGVAEILEKLIPLKQELGMEVSWEVVSGEPDFYQCTKGFHNALQGDPVDIPDRLLGIYEQTSQQNSDRLCKQLEAADFVFIHDPQPAMLLDLCPRRKGIWVWRCHIDLSQPHRPVWDYLKQWVEGYDASIFSLSAFARPLPHTQFLIPPSIDPLSEKNLELAAEEVDAVREEFNLDRDRPLVVQVSRFDRFKDPVGVIQAYRLAKELTPKLQLVLAGGGASDDPEGEIVLEEVRRAASEDPDIHILLLPPDAHRTINALQQAADIVVQKSLREGFGLTVTEGLWKGKPVIGGNSGGIRIQVINHHTGFLVDTPEGAALRMRYLLQNPDRLVAMGRKAKEFVRENFLITRHLRDYLALMVALQRGEGDDRIELSLDAQGSPAP